MKKILALCLFLSAASQISAQEIKTPVQQRQTPAAELELRDRLEADNSFLKMLCSAGRGRAAPDAAKENLRVRRLILEAVRDGGENKIVKAKFTCKTLEATAVANYVIIEKGKAKLIVDASRDKFGSLRVHTFECDRLTAGAYGFDENKKAMVFTPAGEDENFEGKIPFFQCRTTTPDRFLVF